MSSETIFQRPHPNSMLTRDPAHLQGAGCINVSKILTQYRQALKPVTADPAFRLPYLLSKTKVSTCPSAKTRKTGRSRISKLSDHVNHVKQVSILRSQVKAVVPWGELGLGPLMNKYLGSGCKTNLRPFPTGNVWEPALPTNYAYVH